MSTEHRRSLYAFTLVTVLCAGIVFSGLRSDALIGVLRAVGVEATQSEPQAAPAPVRAEQPSGTLLPASRPGSTLRQPDWNSVQAPSQPADAKPVKAEGSKVAGRTKEEPKRPQQTQPKSDVVVPVVEVNTPVRDVVPASPRPAAPVAQKPQDKASGKAKGAGKGAGKGKHRHQLHVEALQGTDHRGRAHAHGPRREERAHPRATNEQHRPSKQSKPEKQAKEQRQQQGKAKRTQQRSSTPQISREATQRTREARGVRESRGGQQKARRGR